MKVSQIQTRGDLKNYISSLTVEYEQTFTGTLEEYLRSLWGLIQMNRESEITFSLLGQLLHDAFVNEPPPFDESWLIFENPPDITLDEKDAHYTDFSILQQMICYQIADLHRMKQAGILDKPYLALGADSPTGNRWFNFDPISYLRCATASMVKNLSATTCNWQDLTLLLWLGQIYE